MLHYTRNFVVSDCFFFWGTVRCLTFSMCLFMCHLCQKFLSSFLSTTTQFDKLGRKIVMELLDKILDDVVRNKSVELLVCNDAILKYLKTMKKNSLLCLETIKVLAGVADQARPEIRFTSV